MIRPRLEGFKTYDAVVRHSRLGRILTALADSPSAVQSLGINPVAARVLAFCLSAVIGLYMIWKILRTPGDL